MVAAVAAFGATPLGRHLSRLGEDFLQEVAAPPVDFSGLVLVDVDEASVNALLPSLGPWPYDRSVFARVNDFLLQRGARSILYDIVFAEPRAGDGELRASLARSPATWLAAIVHDGPAAEITGMDHRYAQLVRSAGIVPRRWSAIVGPAHTLEPGNHVGVVSVSPDQDGQVRRVPLFYDTPAGVVPAIWLSALSGPGESLQAHRSGGQAWLQGAGQRVRVADDGSVPLLIPRNLRELPTVSFSQVYAAVQDGRTALPELAGRTVIVGSTAAVLGDDAFLPGGQAVPGLKILALAHANLARGQVPVAPIMYWHLWLSAACLAVLLLAAGARRARLAWMAAAAAGGIGVLALAAALAMRLALQQAPMYLPMAAVFGSFLSLAAFNLAVEARRDPTTGFFGLPYLVTRIESAIARRHVGPPPALVYLRFDSLALVRDSAGEDAADDLLRQLGAVLRQVMPAEAPVARVAKNAFAVLLPQLVDATDLAGQLSTELSGFRFTWLGRPYHVNVFVSVAGLDREFASADAVLDAADSECHTPVRAGSAINVYRRASRQQRRSEVEGLSLLHTELERENLELLFQPIVPLQAGSARASHCEILLAPIRDGERVLGPAEFVPIAERHGLMPEVDRWVVRAGLRAIAHARKDDPGLEPVIYGLNLSGKSLADPSFVEFICAQMEASGVPSDRLCFELTETAAVADIDAALAFTRRLREKGCLIALDDFGVGFTSFEYIARLPVNQLKIDGTFVRELDARAGFDSVVRAMNEVGHALGMATVAEHVETPQVAARLAAIGVDLGQGHHFARPTSLAALRSDAFAVGGDHFARPRETG